MQGQETRRMNGVETFPMDDLFAVLKNDRRRETVRFLADVEGSVSLSTVATYLANEPDSTRGVSYRSVYVSLQQSHLPILVEHGVVEYDPASRTVGRGPQFEAVADYLANATTAAADRSVLPDVTVASVGLLVLASDRLGLISLGEGGVLLVSAGA
ncbi:hypothetical protein ACFQE1_16995, partial [Halobium palmae]